MFIIGHLRGERTRPVFPIFGKNGTTNQANIKQIGNINNSTSFGGNPQTGRVYDIEGISPTLNTMQGGGLEPKIAIKEGTKKGYALGLKIRKLTPRECWRLQAFPDWAFDKAQEVNSKTQLYKQAGNSVTVNVIKAIAERLK